MRLDTQRVYSVECVLGSITKIFTVGEDDVKKIEAYEVRESASYKVNVYKGKDKLKPSFTILTNQVMIEYKREHHEKEHEILDLEF